MRHKVALVAVAVAMLVSGALAAARVQAEGEAATAATICAGIPAYLAAYDYTMQTWPNAANADDLNYFTAMVRADQAWCAAGSKGSATAVQTAGWHFGQASTALAEYQRIAREGGQLPAPAAPATDGRRTATVVNVVDGDTLDVQLDGATERLRLIGIDTPETVDPGSPVQCYGPEASNRAKELLPVGATVTLAADPTQDVRDRYGRLLVYLWLPDGRNFAETMIADGYAKEYTYERAYQLQAVFREAQARAQQEGRGLWAAATCNGNTSQPAPSAPSTVTPTPPAGEVYYANCDEARRAGAAPIYRGQPGYRPGLDRDNDGVACE